MLESAGFVDIKVQGAYTEVVAQPDDKIIVLIGRKG